MLTMLWCRCIHWLGVTPPAMVKANRQKLHSRPIASVPENSTSPSHQKPASPNHHQPKSPSLSPQPQATSTLPHYHHHHNHNEAPRRSSTTPSTANSEFSPVRKGRMSVSPSSSIEENTWSVNRSSSVSSEPSSSSHKLHVSSSPSSSLSSSPIAASQKSSQSSASYVSNSYTPPPKTQNTVVTKTNAPAHKSLPKTPRQPLDTPKRNKSSAIMARAAFWDKKITEGEETEFPEMPEDSFKR